MKQKTMWAYWDNKRKSFFHIYDREFLVRMCSPDGFKYREQQGEGKVMKVIIKELKNG